MTKGAALHQFFSGFGMDAYAASSVPEDAVFPYLTHDLVIDSFDNGEVSLTVNLWFYTESEAIPNAKAEEISKAIGMGGHLIECDGGCIWLKRGSPFAQSLKDDTAPNIKRRYLNISAEYFTTD
jgi:hypothetical protein